jgi:hypothetical protein
LKEIAIDFPSGVQAYCGVQAVNRPGFLQILVEVAEQLPIAAALEIA